MTSKLARRTTLATGGGSGEGLLAGPRGGPVGWVERLLVKAQGPFFVGARTSPSPSLWVLAYQTLTLPLALWKHVHHFRGMADGSEIRVICVGRRKRFRDLLAGLFGPDRASAEPGQASRDHPIVRIDGMRPRWAWRPRVLRALGPALVMVDVHPWLANGYRRRGWRIVPENVRWQGDLSELPPSRPTESLRSDMRKVERYGYRLEEAEGKEDWEEFIEGMARPHTRARYGVRAWFPAPAQLEHHRKRGRLLFVRREGMRVAGACVLPTPTGLWLPLVGTRDGEERWAREGALSAVYLMTFDWARQHGYRRFDAGTTRPFPKDGVARYKAKLGLAPGPNPLAFANAVLIDPASTSLETLLRAEPLYCLAGGGVEIFPRQAGRKAKPVTPGASVSA